MKHFQVVLTSGKSRDVWGDGYTVSRGSLSIWKAGNGKNQILLYSPPGAWSLIEDITWVSEAHIMFNNMEYLSGSAT